MKVRKQADLLCKMVCVFVVSKEMFTFSLDSQKWVQLLF